jgi:hypothetical protein
MANTANNPANYYPYQPPDYKAAAQAILETKPKFAKQQWNLTQEYAPKQAQLSTDLNAKYAPKNAATLTGIINQTDPEFQAVRNQLGTNALKGLQDGYNLGDDLNQQVNQASRAAQTARGNWYGPAPTAEEAFNNAQARINLYNQRQQQGVQFLQSRGAGDLFSEYSQTLPYAPAQVAPMTSQTTNTNFDTAATLQQANTNYQNQFDNFLYNTSVANGLYDPYTQPRIGGNGLMSAGTGALSGAAAGAMMGSVVPGIGTVAGAIGGAIIGGVGSYAASR